MIKKRIPPLGGICTYEEAFRVGYSVDENVELLRRYNYIKVRLMELAVNHMNRTPEWEVKGAFSYHVWLDTEHSKLIRKRMSEMREPPLHLDTVPNELLKVFLDELLHSHNTIELVNGIYGVVRPMLLNALKKHLAETNPLVDQPTCRILESILLEEAKMLEWGSAAIEAINEAKSALQIADSWKKHLHAFLSAAGGIRGDEPYSAVTPAKRSDHPFILEKTPIRDERFQDIWNSIDTPNHVYCDVTKTSKERVWALLFKRLREMDVPEMISTIIAETPGKPWDYYNDMCRQIWDEARHSMMGEVAFVMKGIDWTKLPIRINWVYEMNTFLTPLERHAVLYSIEFSLMPADTGKKFEWQIAKDSGFALAATFHDHDWADEVLHAQIGRKWYVSEMKSQNLAMDLAKQSWIKLKENQPDYPILNVNWWSDFYESISHLTVDDEPS